MNCFLKHLLLVSVFCQYVSRMSTGHLISVLLSVQFSSLCQHLLPVVEAQSVCSGAPLSAECILELCG